MKEGKEKRESDQVIVIGGKEGCVGGRRED